MNRREAIKTAAIGTLLATFCGGAAGSTSEQVDTMRRIWRWDDTNKCWEVVRMYQLKKGDTFEMEATKGSKIRFHCKADSDPYKPADTTIPSQWGIDANGYAYNIDTSEIVAMSTACDEHNRE